MSRKRIGMGDPRARARWAAAGALGSVATAIAGRRKIMCIKHSELVQFGCPFCGFRSGSSPMSGGGAMTWTCGDCGKGCVAVAEGLKRSPIGLGLRDGTTIYPKVRRHPRYGIPKHGKQDKQPDEGGEFFRSRGIGMDSCTCFVCGTDDRDGEGHNMLHNIAAFVQCREAGERVAAMFPMGARLDYREHEPDRVQVKIGVCDKHLPSLQYLHTACEDGRITVDRVSAALSTTEETKTPSVLDARIDSEEVGFLNRISGALIKAGVETVEILVSKTEDELLRIKGFGTRALAQVRKFLDAHELKLKGDEQDL